MSNEVVFRARVASVMETLTATAVRAVCQIMEESYAALRVEMECRHEPNWKPLTMEIGTGMEKDTVPPWNPCRSSDRIQVAGLRKDLVEEQEDEEEACGADMEDDPMDHNDPTDHDDYTLLLPMSSQGPSQPVKPKTSSEGPSQPVKPKTSSEGPSQPVKPKTSSEGPSQPVKPKTSSSLVKLTEDKLHVTVLEGTSLPPLQRCITCCSYYHCPYCTFFKPARRTKTIQHIRCHLARAVCHKGYTMIRCTFDCREVGHFHCAFCKKILLNKNIFIDHLKMCGGAEPGGTSTNLDPRPTVLDAEAVLEALAKLNATSTYGPMERARLKSNLKVVSVKMLQRCNEQNKGLKTTSQTIQSVPGGMECLAPENHLDNDPNPEEVGLKHLFTEGESSAEDDDNTAAEEEGLSQPTNNELPVTVLKGQTMPPLQRCTTCCRKYHCPFCTAFKPNRKCHLLMHLDTHISRAVFHDGYVIMTCTSNCRKDGHRHHHCPYCKETQRSRHHLISHLRTCRRRNPGGTNTDDVDAASLEATIAFEGITEDDATAALQIEAAASVLTYNLTRNQCIEITPQSQTSQSPAYRPLTTVCDHCGFVLLRKNLKQHMLRKHPEIATPWEGVDPVSVAQQHGTMKHAEGTRRRLTATCSVCGRTVTMKNMRAHMNRKHPDSW